MEYYLILCLINDHFEIFTYDAEDYDEAITLFVDSICPNYSDIRFCGCFIYDEFIQMSLDV